MLTLSPGGLNVHQGHLFLPSTSVSPTCADISLPFCSYRFSRKINIWATSLIVSPFLGPFIACWIVGRTTWRWAFWSLAILNAVAWLLVLLGMDETFYPRNLARGQVPVRKSRTMRLLGVEQWKTNLVPNTFLQAGMRSWTAITKLPVLLCFVYYFMTFAWVIGVNITIGVFIIPAYNFTFDNLGKSDLNLNGQRTSRLILHHSSHVPCPYPWHHSWPDNWPLAARLSGSLIHGSPQRTDHP